MAESVKLEVAVAEPQAQGLQQRLAASAFKLGYQEEQRGSKLVAVIHCTPSQERTVRNIVQELGLHVSTDEE